MHRYQLSTCRSRIDLILLRYFQLCIYGQRDRKSFAVMSSSSSTVSETLHDQSSKLEELGDIEIKSRKEMLFQMLHSYIGDLRCSWPQRERLMRLVENTEKQWEDITSNKQGQAAIDAPLNEVPERISQSSSAQDPLSHFANDLINAFLVASLTDGSRQLHLSQTYTFTTSLGSKAPFRKVISAVIEVPAQPELVLIAFPGKRTQAVVVGYCSQYDCAVFFGKDGRIYLVDFEQMKKSPPEDRGWKIYEAEEVLDLNWLSIENHWMR